ncbi:TetR family transcriptional regulator [Microbacterium sp. Au-Mic1]|uniref:TetR/AcrR family transcriptional regulator n=1 Tax=Microbacterium sp. Au-Mic1 TaxID=2906457 RepID=UPI001E5DF585|nr:TetR/AcrR family transcriptional regulator [Microbacterium sp. Au-Mic1]MCE4026564.1 TetR family transcriptional regulator [Microbacterium sp. Au-Mic1]
MSENMSAARTPRTGGEATALPRRATQRRRNRAGEERREAVLAAAIDQFGRFGYAGTSIASIARAAGITDSGVLHHFPSKIALYRAIVLGRGARFVAAFGDPTTLDELFDALAAGVAASLADPALVRLQAMLTGEMLIEGHPLRDEYLESQRSGLDGLSAKLRAVAVADGHGEIDAERLALRVLAMLKGLRAEWAALPDHLDLAEASAEALAVLRAALR